MNKPQRYLSGRTGVTVSDRDKPRADLIEELAELRRLVGQFKQIGEDALEESLERWRSITEDSPDHVYILDRDLKIEFINYVPPGLTPNELIGSPIDGYFETDQRKPIMVALHNSVDTAVRERFDSHYRTPDGETTYFESTVVPRLHEGKVVGLAICSRDVTDRVHAILDLELSRQQLEQRNFLLERKDIALHELMDQVKEERGQIEKRVLANVERIIMPLLARMKEKDGRIDAGSLTVIEESLRTLTSGFADQIGRKMLALTPRELEICNMIKSGLSTKEIADVIGISSRGVETHRRNIRQKLDLTNRDVNLTTYLNNR